MHELEKYDIGREFDIMIALVEKLGFSGESLDVMVGWILHAANSAIRNEMNYED